MRLDYLTIFPDFFAPLELSLPGKASASGLLDVGVHDLRRWTDDVHRTVDDAPYGGGPGMVMRPEPWGRALETVRPPGTRLGVPTPAGERFTQATAAAWAAEPGLVFACGRYEGIDERFLAANVDEEISLGDYVLSGGELGAAVIIDAVARLQEGALNDAESAAQDSFEGDLGLLDCPHFSQPAQHPLGDVPDVLRSGNHAAIAAWRRQQSLIRTAQRRPDLLDEQALGKADRKLLAQARQAPAEKGRP